jgi:argonaute-like protein implicated in RNA metabolism and viral defense
MIENVLEGTFFLIDKSNTILSPTGSSTLNQGTAHPILIKKIIGTTDIKVILQDIFALTQLNFSSPTVAQGHCLPIKRADEQLKDRKMQEVERIK